MDSRRYSPGLTLASIPAIVLSVFVMSVLVQYFDIIVCTSFSSEHTLALPTMWTFLGLLLFTGICYGATRIKLLTRAELLCVLFAMLIAAPLLSQGFWHRIVSVVATNPRGSDFDKMDATNDRLWPHGPNLLNGSMVENADIAPSLKGSATWSEAEVEPGLKSRVAVLANKEVKDVSTIRFKMPLEKDGIKGISADCPYLVSILGRATDLGPDSKYFCRLYSDENTEFSDAFTGSEVKKITFLHKTGFRRLGAYGVKFSSQTSDHIYVEFGLQGPGRLELYDPKLFSVEALETIYKGRRVVTESQLKDVPETQRSGLIIKPDNLWSVKGVEYLMTGYIPWRDWVSPFWAWTSFIGLILMGCLAVNIIMRKQWLENERYLMPLTRIPVALLGGDGEEGAKPIWKSSLAWSGFFVALAWTLLKAAHFYNPKVPDTTVFIRGSEYFTDPGWGGMFTGPKFEINGIFLSLAVFMELNVLISIVVGYWCYRFEMLVGYKTRLNLDPQFPQPYHQQTGAYLAYFAAGLFLARRYLWRVLKSALGMEGGEQSEGELLSYRWALIALMLSIVGIVGWAWWLNISVPGILIFFMFLLSVGFVASKLRTECGTPWGYFAPGYFVPIVLMLGGIKTFGPEAMILCLIASFFLAPTVFFMIPGAQLEFTELGRRMNVVPRHVLITCFLAIVLGMLFGGFVFLSNSYSLSGESFRYNWAYDTKAWYFNIYNPEMVNATNDYLASSGQATTTAPPVTGVPQSTWAFLFAASVTIVLSVLRQMFAWFPMHPAGWVLGLTNFSDYVWGSCFTAWIIRGLALWFGGAATVRNKLIPFFVGFFLGSIMAELLIGVHAAYLRSIGIEKFYSSLGS